MALFMVMVAAMVVGYTSKAYAAPGYLDPSFDTDGKLTTDFSNNHDFAMDLAVQQDGKIVVAGIANNGSTTGNDFTVARYNPNGTLDTSFGAGGVDGDGRVTTAIGSGTSPDAAFAVAVRADGKIVVAGSANTGYNDFAVARYYGGDDATKPVVKPPAQTLITNSTLGTSTTSASVPTRISWSATDSEGEVTRYQLQQSTNGGSYQNINLPSATTTSTTRLLTPATNYRYRVRATDDNGNTSFFKYGPSFTVDAHQESSSAIAYSGTWRRQALSGSYGGVVKYATAKGATATLTFTGRNVAWVAPKSKTRGKVEVYLDGAKVATVDLYSSTALSRRVSYSANGLNPSVSHTLQIKVLGTSGRPRVDVDAFVVLR